MEAIVLSFIGNTQSYLDECIYQIRLFTNKPIYYIYDDYNNEIIENIYNKYQNINLINYELVKSDNFDNILNKRRNRFHIVDKIYDRKELFIRSFERFYLLYNLCILKKLENVLFLELDNLIYDDPDIWFSELTENKLFYMKDNINVCSSGLFISRNNKYLNDLLNHFSNFIMNYNGFLSEMTALNIFYENHKDKVYILPTHWNIKDYSLNFKNTLFDALPIGVFLFGTDKSHSNGVIKKGVKSHWSFIDFTQYQYKWIKDEKNRSIPYISNENKLIKINNLHIHSKTLNEAISIINF
tara:strand:- start:14 stop:907 length:894 start_codon:yes stop_codon:yes gene_type:complete